MYNGAQHGRRRAGTHGQLRLSGRRDRCMHAGLSPQGVLFNDLTPAIGRYAALYHSEPVGQVGYSG